MTPSIELKNASFSYYIVGKDTPKQKPQKDDDSALRNVLGSDRNFVGGKIVKHMFSTEVCALRNITFTLKEGERLGLVGVNGSGKSTLLKACSGHFHAREGSIKIQGKTCNMLNLGTGMIPMLSGKKNVELKALYFGISPKEIPDMIKEAKILSGLGDFFEMPVMSYSSGMMTRLIVGFLTLMRGDIMILDEWLGAGDATVNDTGNVLQERILTACPILIIASHSESILENYTDRLIWLHKGEIVEDGPTAQVLEQYQHYVRRHNNEALEEIKLQKETTEIAGESSA